MNHYLVTWSIDEFADSPEEAARMAIGDMHGASTTIVKVKDLTNGTRTKQIDIEVMAHKVSPDHPDHPWKQAMRRGDYDEANRLLTEAREEMVKQGRL